MLEISLEAKHNTFHKIKISGPHFIHAHTRTHIYTHIHTYISVSSFIFKTLQLKLYAN